MTEEPLWDPGQDWIQIFDNLLKHPQELKLCLEQDTENQTGLSGHLEIDLIPASFKSTFQGVKKGCDCDMCKQSSPASNNGQYATRISRK